MTQVLRLRGRDEDFVYNDCMKKKIGRDLQKVRRAVTVLQLHLKAVLDHSCYSSTPAFLFSDILLSVSSKNRYYLSHNVRLHQ